MTRNALENNHLQDLINILYELLVESTVPEPQLTFEQIVETVQWTIDQHETAPRLLLYTFSQIPATEKMNQVLLNLNIDRSLLLLVLDPQTLISLKISNPMFEKKIVRANTNLLYKQKRFNLLREESEGYAKLVVELYGASSSGVTRKNRTARAMAAASVIQSLIGYFDLDPVRSLDILLDIIAMNIVRQSRFYLEVLKHSTWWPANRATHCSLQTLGNGGNPMAAQVIGFKIRSYSQIHEPVPDAYMMMVAVLLKEGFISLGDLYPFLSPSDKELMDYEDEWKKEMDQKAFTVRASALALAAPLMDDADTSSGRSKLGSDDQVKPQIKENKKTRPRISQKAQLLQFLLAVGSLYPSLFILSKFPFLPEAHPEIADMINRIVEYMIEPLVNNVARDIPKTPSAALLARQIPISTIRDTELGTPRKQGDVFLLTPPVSPISGGYRTRFFYEDWNAGLSTIDSLEGLQQVSDSLLKYSGPLLSRNAQLLVRLCRIATSYLKAEEHEEFWYEYFRNHILGAISMVGPNPGIIHEVFTLMQYFSYESRYALYGEWSAVLAKSNPHLKFATSKAEKDTKDVLKRLSKTNVKEMFRRLAKISYANPIPSFSVFMGQVESYDNLGDLVVEGARYFTDMGWDILPFVIMMQLTSGRGTMQSSGMNDRKWLQSLASFSAKLCRRYSLIDSSPLVLFLLKEFHLGSGATIILLRDLITQMGGISQLSNVSKSQIEGLGGCPSLRTLIFESIGDKRSVSARSGKRFSDVLTNLKITSEMFIILSQTHKTFIYRSSDEEAYQKVLAHRYDELTHVLIQYTEFVNEFMDPDIFKNEILSIAELCNTYGVNPTWAFGLWRNNMAAEIRKFTPTEDDDGVSLASSFQLIAQNLTSLGIHCFGG